MSDFPAFADFEGALIPPKRAEHKSKDPEQSQDTASLPNTDKVTRFEVIDHTKTLEKGGGRIITKYKVRVDLDLQDDGRTLKVFLS